MIAQLKKANRIEMEGVYARMTAPDFFEAMSKYMARSMGSQKSKL